MFSSSARLSLAFSNIGHSFSHLFMLLYPTVVFAAPLLPADKPTVVGMAARPAPD